MIHAVNLCKKYGELTAVDNISLTIQEGEFLILSGESGSGKTTLLSMLSTLEKPTRGEVYYGDSNIYSLPEKEICDLRLKDIGIIFQRFYLEMDYSVLENVLLPLQIRRGSSWKEAKEQATKIIGEVGLGKVQNSKAKLLSGGEMQRCCIARALVNHPNTIFADEPCGNLDSKNGFAVMDLLQKENKAGETIILVTHNKDHFRHASRIVELKDGRIVSDTKDE